jgi:hypothetical protein
MITVYISMNNTYNETSSSEVKRAITEKVNDSLMELPINIGEPHKYGNDNYGLNLYVSALHIFEIKKLADNGIEVRLIKPRDGHLSVLIEVTL